MVSASASRAMTAGAAAAVRGDVWVTACLVSATAPVCAAALSSAGCGRAVLCCAFTGAGGGPVTPVACSRAAVAGVGAGAGGAARSAVDAASAGGAAIGSCGVTAGGFRLKAAAAAVREAVVPAASAAAAQHNTCNHVVAQCEVC